MCCVYVCVYKHAKYIINIQHQVCHFRNQLFGDDVGVEPLQYMRLRHEIVVAGLESGEKSFGCLG